MQEITEHTVASKDGTTIGYRALGTGPGLVIIHGSMSSGYNHLELAQALADNFTIYLLDRRGRGLSGPYKESHTMQADVDDIAAVLQETGVKNVFGVSVGGLIALTAATQLQIKKLAVYEPLVFRDKAAPDHMLQELDRELASNDVAGAMATAMQQAHLGSAFMNKLPHGLMAFMSKGMMNWTPKGDYIPFKDLVPPLHYEGVVIVEKSGQQTSFATITAEVLLLNGGKSSKFLKDATQSVMEVLPSAQHIQLPGLDHSSPWNKAIRGNPLPIARQLTSFFLED